jgi:Ca2+-binding RTX toxin-like protein
LLNYAFEGAKWTNPVVTWSFATATYNLAEPFSSPIGSAYQGVIRQAFAAWAQYSGLAFSEVSDSTSVDIRVGFASLTGSEIGDTFFYSSQGAFLPGVVVRLEDPAQIPLINVSGTYTYSGHTTTLQQVADHEIGHSLGMAHSTDSNAIMYPILGLSNPTLDDSDIFGIEALYSNFLIAVLDTTTGQGLPATAQAYSGPVSGLLNEYINITSDSLNISAASPGWFIHSGSGDDAIAVSSGINVLDGGTGSNFLTGGSGTDTFFVDDRGPTGEIWSTVSNFHAGDAATIWGVTPQDFGLAWVDGQGAAGFTGLTLHATASGKPTASLTLTGFTQADMGNGRLSVNFGTDPASGSAYMYVHENS